MILRLFLRAAHVCFSGQCCGVSLTEACSVSRDGRFKKGSLQATMEACVMCDLCQIWNMARHARSSPAAQSAQFCFGCQWVACCSQSQRRLCRSREARERKGGLPQAKLQSMRSHRAERKKFFHVFEVWRDSDDSSRANRVSKARFLIVLLGADKLRGMNEEIQIGIWDYIILGSARLLSQSGHLLPASGS